MKRVKLGNLVFDTEVDKIELKSEDGVRFLIDLRLPSKKVK